MRIFVAFENTRWGIDVQPAADVQTVKAIVDSKLLDDTHEDKEEGKILVLNYGGASLQDDWVLQDLGINSGSTLKCELKHLVMPKLRVVLGYSTDETLELMDEIDPFVTTVGEVKSMISKKLGLPVSAYRLCLMNPPNRTASKLKVGKVEVDREIELYDCSRLESYGLETGDTIKLDVWNGWSEFIRVALLGHYKLLGQYLSYSEDERLFQRRVALHIAAHFDFTGLAHALIRVGTRSDVPVGTHPKREWCSEDDHVETKKCAIHEASEMGNVNVMRILLKSNILCIAVRDGKGRTPWQIVVEHFHKDCFEYLLARQWARKSGKDNISLSIVIYSRLMKWCERARHRVLVKYGASKSTLRGRTIRSGALVGNGVAIDGLKNKAMSSVPLSAMPRPAVNFTKVLPALAKARRRFKRDKSFVAVTSHKQGRRPSESQQSSRISLSRKSVSTQATGRWSDDSSQVFANDDWSTVRPVFQGRDANGRERAERSSEEFRSIRSESGTLPLIRPPDKGEPRKQLDSDRDTTRLKDALIQQANQRNRSSLSGINNGPVTSSVKGDKAKDIRLPFNRQPEFRKPYIYWGSSEDTIENTLSTFESYRGTSARENAIRCLSISDTFTKKSFLKRTNMAVCLAKRGVTKNVGLQT